MDALKLVTAPRIAVLDYGSGNLHSVCRALNTAGAQVCLTADAAAANACDGLVVPGVGAFAACMEGLQAVRGDELIRNWVADNRPVLGICVGHQILFERGVEHGIPTAGVGVLPGVVEQLSAKRLPHMGWNTVQPPADTKMFAGITAERFYFVHSYAVGATAHGRPAITFSEHEGPPFVSAVEHGALWSVQFHPEKSGAAGAQLLRNWLDTIAAGDRGRSPLQTCHSLPQGDAKC
jgi:glutamine amidotransferase